MNIPNDPVIQELIQEFVDSWINDLNNDYANLIETKNSDDLYRMAHTLKGSCFQFGLDEIAEMGIKLMELTKQGNWEEAKTYESLLLDKFNEVKALIEKQ